MKPGLLDGLSPEIAAIIGGAIERRTAAGLRLAFITERHNAANPFVCYPHDEATKQRWIASAARKGWTLAE